jgi:hypothetical protein
LRCCIPADGLPDGHLGLGFGRVSRGPNRTEDVYRDVLDGDFFPAGPCETGTLGKIGWCRKFQGANVRDLLFAEQSKVDKLAGDSRVPC